MTKTTNWEQQYDETFADNNELMHYQNEAKVFIRSLLAQQREELLDLVEKEVIGGNEKYLLQTSSNNQSSTRIENIVVAFRNELRQEQRQKLSDLRLPVKDKK